MDFEKLITKKIDLDKNDGLSSFMGLACQQNHNVFEVFYNFFKEVRPVRVLEIGTALGGFTQFLKKISDDLELNLTIRTYDIHEMNWYKDLINDGIDVRVENVFGENYSSLKNDVIDYIKEGGVVVVLCDGGNKVEEFKMLSNHLKIGDFILTHDYCEDRETFDKNYKNKIWNWHEISENDISESCLKNNLVSFNKEIFNSVVWACKLKKS